MNIIFVSFSVLSTICVVESINPLPLLRNIRKAPNSLIDINSIMIKNQETISNLIKNNPEIVSEYVSQFFDDYDQA